jgi:hypothetical protein
LHTPADAVLTATCQSEPAVRILRDQVWKRRPYSELNGIVWVIEVLEFTHPDSSVGETGNVAVVS